MNKSNNEKRLKELNPALQHFETSVFDGNYITENNTFIYIYINGWRSIWKTICF